MSRRRLDVTATHAVSSMLATLTGAVVASGLGIAGTLIGAAFMSLASTVGAAVYKHYLGRSKKRLRAAAASLAPLASGNAVAAAVIRHAQVDDEEDSDSDSEAPPVRRGGRHRADAAGPDTKVDSTQAELASADGASADGAQSVSWEDITMAGFLSRTKLGRLTSLENGAGPPDGSGPRHGLPSADRIGPAHDAGALDGAGPVRGAETGEGVSFTGGNGVPGSIGDPDDADATRPGSKRRWLLLAGAALSVFVLAMGVVTAVEAIAGKPLETVVWHRSDSGSGTTLGGLVHHHPRQSPKPGSSTLPTGSPSSTEPSGTPSGSGSPTPGVSPSSSASSGVSAPASSGAGTGTSSGAGAASGAGTGAGTQ